MSEFERLTDRERDVAALIAQGLSDAAIAERLGIEARTVGTHILSIYATLRAPDRKLINRRVWLAMRWRDDSTVEDRPLIAGPPLAAVDRAAGDSTPGDPTEHAGYFCATHGFVLTDFCSCPDDDIVSLWANERDEDQFVRVLNRHRDGARLIPDPDVESRLREVEDERDRMRVMSTKEQQALVGVFLALYPPARPSTSSGSIDYMELPGLVREVVVERDRLAALLRRFMPDEYEARQRRALEEGDDSAGGASTREGEGSDAVTPPAVHDDGRLVREWGQVVVHDSDDGDG